MKYKRMGGVALILSATMALTACGAANASSPIPTNAQTASVVADTASSNADTADTNAVRLDADTTQTATFADAFSSRDLSGTYDASGAVRITLNGASASCDSGAVTVSGSTVTITAAGTYLLSGALNNGTVIVDAGKEDKVQLVLNGVSIHSDTFAAVYVRQADKVFLTLADGTVNTLSNGGTFELIDDNNVDGAVFSKDDLTLNGTGKLAANSPAKHGIVCKDDLVVTGGAYEITAASHALSGEDSVNVAGGSFTLTAGKDGVHCENDADTAKGNVYIADGTMTIEADGDGVSASGALQIDGGAVAVKPGGGSQNARSASDESRKALKADGGVILNGGTFAIDAADDGIHSNANVQIAAGQYAIVAGDDGIHADGLLQIDGGAVDINAFEGLEGTYIRINNGTVNIYASDDGINAARKSNAYSSTVEINGGEIKVEVGPGDTDGIDSNGALIITGGTVDVTGNSAFDCDGSLTFSGGTVIVNGQQVDTIPNQQMGGRGGRGGMGGAFGGGRTFGQAPDGGNVPMPDGNARRPARNGGTFGGNTQNPDGNNGTTQTPNGNNGTVQTPDGSDGNAARQWGVRSGKGRKTDGAVTGENSRNGNGQTTSELPDAVTAPTQKTAFI